MAFDLKDKVVIITGGASGIGLCCAKELLENDIRGVTIADINEESGRKIEKELNSKFGVDKVFFVKTDVTDYKSFENAFVLTAEKFENIDILINNAGICNDSIWEKEVNINVNGTIHGVLLGLETYIPRYKSSDEGIICNVSSIRGVSASADRPIYTGTKFAIHGMTLAWGCRDHYERTKVKVIGVCPGGTATPLTANAKGTTLGQPYEEIRMNNSYEYRLFRQKPEECAKHMIEVLKTAKTGTIWVIETNEKNQYVMPNYSLAFIKK